MLNCQITTSYASLNWLSNAVSSDDLYLTVFKSPFRQDRSADAHGGILVYVSDQLFATRRRDLEIQGTECIWLEISIHNKPLLIGTFYRPPNSLPGVLSTIENSIGLAVDTGIADIVITGDLNLDILKQSSYNKIHSIEQQYNISQIIRQPTLFTESSSISH